MARTFRNLHPQVCSLENVMAAARSAMQGKMSGHAAARFHARWETHAVRLHQELTVGSWQPGPYTYFDIHIRRHGLPIGNLTSQFFANVHLDGFDHFVKQELGVKGYVRYMDDFLILAESREQARAWGRQAREYLTARRMEIHPDKYQLCRTDREGADFCGIPREKVRLVARATRGLLEQQREQPARIQPQQQRPHEREQQRGVPSRQALEGALPSHR